MPHLTLGAFAPRGSRLHEKKSPRFDEKGEVSYGPEAQRRKFSQSVLRPKRSHMRNNSLFSELSLPPLKIDKYDVAYWLEYRTAAASSSSLLKSHSLSSNNNHHIIITINISNDHNHNNNPNIMTTVYLKHTRKILLLSAPLLFSPQSPAMNSMMNS